MAYGTLSVADLLAANSGQTIARIGEDRAFMAIDQLLQAHNMLLREKIALLVESTTDRLRRFGGQDTMVEDEIDEFGTPDAQKVVAGQTLGFPLRLYGISVQWTRKYLQNAILEEFSKQFDAARDADIRRLDYNIRRALFVPTNYTWIDRFVDNVSLAVKALANADGAPLPTGPNGEFFDGTTHTHYLGTSSFVAADVTALIETVVEHYDVGVVQVYINRAQETTVRGFTGFLPYQIPGSIPATTAASVPTQLDPRQLYNRAIGVFGNQGAEIWVKPWVPSGYIVALIQGIDKPLALRERDNGSMGLVVAAEDEEHPLRARTLENEYGIACWNRVGAAVLDTGHSSYTAPTLTM